MSSPVSLKHQTARSIEEPSSGPHIEYFGGKVLKKPRFVSIYAGSYWTTAKGAKDRSYFDRGSRAIVGGAYANTWAEYGGGKGVFAGSTIVNGIGAGRYGAGEIEIESAVKAALASKQVPAPDGQTVYTVFLDPATVLRSSDGSDSRHGLGGYHGSFVDRSSGKRVYYAALAYAGAGSGVPFTKSARDNTTIAASHEWAEAVTDPDVNAGRLGWYDRDYGEVGDIPLSAGLPLSAAWGRVDGFAVQKEWSERQHAPVLGNENGL